MQINTSINKYQVLAIYIIMQIWLCEDSHTPWAYVAYPEDLPNLEIDEPIILSLVYFENILYQGWVNYRD